MTAPVPVTFIHPIALALRNTQPISVTLPHKMAAMGKAKVASGGRCSPTWRVLLDSSYLHRDRALGVSAIRKLEKRTILPD